MNPNNQMNPDETRIFMIQTLRNSIVSMYYRDLIRAETEEEKDLICGVIAAHKYELNNYLFT